MKKFMVGSILFIGGLLGVLLFPITAQQGSLGIETDILSLSIFIFIVMIIFGFSICIYEAYLRK